MATEFNYTREWTDAEAFPLLSFTKNWENPEDYPTYEPDEMQVRRDMQSLHDEVKDFLNNELIPRVIAEDATVEGWEAQETARADAETARAEAETARAEAEHGRVDAEAARVQTEAARVETEAARATAEQARASAEVARAEAETARASAEQNRANAESARVTAEAARAAAESARVTTEANRESAESGRAAAESARTTAETARADAEAKRVSAEQARVSAEKARADAESARTSEFATLKTNVEAATNSANTAADKVNKMTVSATDLTPGSAATVTKGTNTNGGIDLKFGIPEGAQGKTGNGIKSINKTGGTGAAGTYDTYTITMTDGSTFNFRVLNGANGKDGDGTGDMVAGTYDPQGKRTDIFAYVEEHGGVQSDWNQNDPDAPDYVKNRTHYSHVDIVPVMGVSDNTKFQGEAVTITFKKGNQGVATFYEDALPIESEKTYIVMWDGVEYECVCYQGEDENTYYLPSLGGSEYPFSIHCDADYPVMYITAYDSHGNREDVSASHTIAVNKKDETIYTLDGKYLPAPYIKAGTGKHSEIFNDPNNIASGNYSHAEGSGTEAGHYSHAEGVNTVASGYRAHAEGIETVASGNQSHAEGEATIASKSDQHVQGCWNIEDTNTTFKDQYLHIVGNGKYDYTVRDYVRSNAHTLDRSGNAWFAGDVYIGSTSGTNKDDGSKKLATIADIEAAIGSAIGGSY